MHERDTPCAIVLPICMNNMAYNKYGEINLSMARILQLGPKTLSGVGYNQLCIPKLQHFMYG